MMYVDGRKRFMSMCILFKQKSNPLLYRFISKMNYQIFSIITSNKISSSSCLLSLFLTRVPCLLSLFLTFALIDDQPIIRSVCSHAIVIIRSLPPSSVSHRPIDYPIEKFLERFIS